MDNSYKIEHERFVSGHSGTSFFEVSSISISSFSVCLLRDVFYLTLQPNLQSDTAKKKLSTLIIGGRFVSDFILLVVPSVLSITLLSDHLFWNFFAIPIICITMLSYHCIRRDLTFQIASTLDKFNLGTKSFITNFRSLTTLNSAILILAVDFRIFPRRFAKAEIYGYSVMDTGVGFFALSNAIVSPEARGKSNLQSLKQQMVKTIVSSIPLLILGFVRLLTVKNLDYHEHVTEYGVHWNFFFTLAVLKIVCSFLLIASKGQNTLTMGIVITALHQLFLNLGLSSYILNGTDKKGGRHGLIDSNREGIFSFPGYIAIYLIGVWVGKFLFQERSNIREWLHALVHILMIATVSSTFMLGLNAFIEPVSRRFCNGAYVFFVIGQSSLTLAVTLLADICKTFFVAMTTQVNKMNPSDSLQFDSNNLVNKNETSNQDVKVNSTTSFSLSRKSLPGSKVEVKSSITCQNDIPSIYLLNSISFNSLLFFLLANVLTGIINMMIPTIHMSNFASLLIMIIYMLILNMTMFILHEKGISTKIW